MLELFAPLLSGAITDKRKPAHHFRIVHSLREVREERAVVIGRYRIKPQ